MAIQIFIVEDHKAVRDGYVLLLEYEPDLIVCGVADSGEEAVVRIPLCQPDLVLVDLSLPGMNGLTLIERLSELQLTLPILIVSAQDLSLYSNPSLSVRYPNIRGYLHKFEAYRCLVSTIRQVLAA